MRWRRPKSREQELERELRAHLELEAEEQRERGLTGDEAQYAARRALGNLTYTKEEVRQMWGFARWDVLAQDIRYAFRSLRRSPGFAVTAALTLALGIGASTAVFTVVDSVLLKPLAYPNSGALAVAWERIRFLNFDVVGPNPRHVDGWEKRSKSFLDMAFLRYTAHGLALGSEHPRLVGVVVCQPTLFGTLGVQPALGRAFAAENGVPGHDGVAILTYPLWQSVFHGDAGAIGQTIRLDDVPRQIVGVLPASFHFPNSNALRSIRGKQPASGAPEPAIFIPAAVNMTEMSWNGNFGNWVTIGRLRPGVSLATAEAELNAIQAQIMREIPANQAGDRRPNSILVSMQPMQEAVIGESKTGLWLLMGAVTGLMLIACLNLANAQLGRAMVRRRDAALRTALGAARWRLLWNALAENLLLAAFGGGAGILLAYAGLRLFRSSSIVDLPRLAEVHVNLSVLLFSTAVTVAATVLSGMLPAIRLISTDPHTSLQQGQNRAFGSRHGTRTRHFLIGVQVFGCTALLLVTGLFAKSLLHLLRQDKGFETDRIAIAEVRLNPKTYGEDKSRIGFDQAVLQNLQAIPGVQSAALVSAMPLEGEWWIESAQRVDRPNRETPLINFRWVSPGYFQTTGQRLVAGRFLEEYDRERRGTVISESEAKSVWGSEDPIGGQLRIEGRVFTVVGVVADSRNTSLKTAPPRMAFVHYADRPPYPTFFLVRSAQPLTSLAPAIRQAIWKHDPGVTIARVKSFDSQLTDSLQSERFQTFVLVAFGISALLLAMLGIYGVLSYSVTTRKQEIGVRMALGASRAGVYGLTIGEAAAPVIIGLAGGIAANVLAQSAIRKFLYGIEPIDGAVVATVTAVFLLAAGAAAFLPARRAASVDPMEALRSE